MSVEEKLETLTELFNDLSLRVTGLLGENCYEDQKEMFMTKFLYDLIPDEEGSVPIKAVKEQEIYHLLEAWQEGHPENSMLRDFNFALIDTVKRLPGVYELAMERGMEPLDEEIRDPKGIYFYMFPSIHFLHKIRQMYEALKSTGVNNNENFSLVPRQHIVTTGTDAISINNKEVDSITELFTKLSPTELLELQTQFPKVYTGFLEKHLAANPQKALEELKRFKTGFTKRKGLEQRNIVIKEHMAPNMPTRRITVTGNIGFSGRDNRNN